MHYDSVLTYIRKVLENRHIPTIIYEEPFEKIESIDYGLRESLFKDFNKKESLMHFINVCRANTLYYVTDEYFCSYICMQLPNSQKQQYFIIGPFTYININQKNYLKLLEKLDIPAKLLPILENYYYNIAFISSETQFKNLINTFCDTLWYNSPYSVSVVHGDIWNFPYGKEFNDLEIDPNLMPANMNVVEARYSFENHLMQAVSQGNLSLVDQLLFSENSIRYVPRLSNTLRDYKNYMIILNTLLRKAAETRAVHPVYLDQLSSKFAKKIEALSSVTNHSMEREMLHKYCLLVRNYSVKGYSPIVQKVINQINLNLTSDLGLSALSEMFSISAGYLSTLFKKETGITLTDYVNKKRVEHAIFLLNTTQFQIQTIASYCGVEDINYFTRIFKKFTNMTPTKYREIILKPSENSRLENQWTR